MQEMRVQAAKTASVSPLRAHVSPRPQSHPVKRMSQKQTPGFSSPHTELFLRLLRIADQLERAFQQQLRPHALTHPQYNVLRILRGAGPSGLTCSAVGRSMITAVPDITRLLARLQARRLVTQHRDSADRRVVWTRITARGLDLLRSLDSLVEQIPPALLRSLSEREVREINQQLQKIVVQPAEEPTVPKQKKLATNQPASGPLGCPSAATTTRPHPATLDSACPASPRTVTRSRRSSRSSPRPE